MRHLIFISILSACSALKAQLPQVTAQSPFAIGETVQFYSKELKENRTLNVYLPPDYQRDSAHHYPVIYLLDGSADEDFIHVAGLVQFANFPWVNTLPPTIVVGIANVDRKRDFTFPTRQAEDRKLVPNSGGSAAFIRFIAGELQPLIEQRYATDSTKILIGQSLGGLVASEILLKRPDLFTHYVIVSPSLWWDQESLLTTRLPVFSSPKTIFLTAGKEEEATMVRTATELADKLRQAPAGQIHQFFNIMEGQNHGNILHLAVYEAFEKMFGPVKK